MPGAEIGEILIDREFEKLRTNEAKGHDKESTIEDDPQRPDK